MKNFIIALTLLAALDHRIEVNIRYEGGMKIWTIERRA